MRETSTTKWRAEGDRLATEELPAVDVRQLKRESLITSQQAQLVTTAEGANLRLVWTPCNLGGS